MESIESLLPRTHALIQQGIEERLHLGVQMFVSVAGETIVDAAWGEAAPGQPLTNTDLVWWLSSGKPVTAAALLRLVEQKELTLEDPVARFLPEFAEQGKGTINVRHLLMHTAGLQPVPTGWPRASWADSLARICRGKVRAGGEAGASPAYDPARTWFVLGELIRLIDGRPVERYVREEICEPLQMVDCWMSLPPQQHAAYGARIARMHSLVGDHLSSTDDHLAEVCQAPSPGGSFRGPVRQLARFYEMLMQGGELGGVRLLEESTVQLMTSRQRIGQFDLTFQQRVDFGLGLMIDSNQYGSETVPYGFGRHCSRSTFGHGGSESSIGFCDPERKLIVVWAANGRPGELRHHTRNLEINSALYEDLGLNRHLSGRSS